MAKVKATDQKTTLNNWNEVDNALNRIAELNLDERRISDAMNQKINDIQEKYHDNLDPIAEEKLQLERNIELFCKSVRDEEFQNSKTKKLRFGEVSFRLGNPTLKNLKGWTWESIKTLLMKSKRYTQFLRTKIEINKQSIMDSRLNEKQLAEIGMTLEQKENFYYEIYERK